MSRRRAARLAAEAERIRPPRADVEAAREAVMGRVAALARGDDPEPLSDRHRATLRAHYAAAGVDLSPEADRARRAALTERIAALKGE